MEPTCFRDKGIGSAVLTPRQACAVESAAKMNPTSNIFLLYLTPNDFLEDSKKLVSILESYDNIYIRRIHFPTYISDSPLSKWYRKNLEEFLDADANPKSISDIIKFLTLWKNGGIYLDLDVIVQKCVLVKKIYLFDIFFKFFQYITNCEIFSRLIKINNIYFSFNIFYF